MAFMWEGKVFFFINLTAEDQPIQSGFESYDPEAKHYTRIKGKLYHIKAGGYRIFSLSELEKKAERAERFACFGLVLMVGDCERVRLGQIRNNIGAIVTKNAGELKMSFVSREEFSEKASLSISPWKRKERRDEMVEEIKQIFLNKVAEINGNVQAQTFGTMLEPGEPSNQGAEIEGIVQSHASEDKDKGSMSDPEAVGTTMRPGTSSNQNGPISKDKGQTVRRTGCFNLLLRRTPQRNT